jgi:hypothetical protein
MIGRFVLSSRGATARASAHRESLVLGLVALLPIVPYLLVVGIRGCGRFELGGDLAEMQRDVIRVWRGGTLLGLESRYHWYHPGPILYYILAPFDWLSEKTSTGFFLGTSILSCAAVATVVAATRRWGARRHAVVALLVLMAWLAAFGNVVADPWCRVVVVLPLIACLVLCAFLTLGEGAALAPAIFFGSVAAQTHLGSLTTVVASIGAATVLYVAQAVRSGTWSRGSSARLAACAAFGVLLWLPPVVQQLQAPAGAGNLSKLHGFLAHRKEGSRPLFHALADWTTATSWLPERLGTASLPEDGPIPFAMRWDPMPFRVTPLAWAFAALHAIGLATAGIVAWRRHDRVSLALLGIGAFGDVIAIASLRALGPDDRLYSLLFWTTAASTVASMGILAAFGGTLLDRARIHRAVVVRAAATGCIATALVSTYLEGRWLCRFPFAPASSPETRDDRAALYRAMTERTLRDGALPVVHREGGWAVATGIVLEYERDGVDWRSSSEDAWSFPGARLAEPTAPQRHFWFADPWSPLRLAPCLELLGRAGILSVYTATSDVVSCRP